MERISNRIGIITFGLLGTLTLVGCQPPRVPVTVGLQPSIGSFTVQAGVPAAKSGSVTFSNTSGIQVGSGTFNLDPAAITVTAAGPAKLVTLQAGTSTLTVTAKIAPLEEQATVCESGETYGPFEVTLDAGLNPVSVDPPTVTLTENTVALLNAGEFSLCLEVVSPVDGTVTIANLDFDLGL